MRGWVAKALTVVLAAGGLQGIAVAAPAWACGCGAYIPGANGSASVSDEQAVVRFDGTTEDVVMRFSVRSNASDAAWVMPVPGPAQAFLNTTELFDDVASAQRPRTEVRHYFWPHLDTSDGEASAKSGGAAPAPGSAVQVLGDQVLGGFEVANLAASDPAALGSWLDLHHFTLKPGTADRLAAYTAQGWTFVAIRLASGTRADLNGNLDPIRISFPAKEAVYPMRLSAGATTPQHVRLAVLAPHRMDATTYPVPDRTATSTFGDWIDPSETGTALANLAAGRMFLTVYDAYFTQPALITQDYTFNPAHSDWIQHPVVSKEELLTFIGIPVYLLLLLGIATAIALAAWQLRRSARKRRGAGAAPGFAG